jgi:hypothetical protein
MPTTAELDVDIAKIDAALSDAIARFQVDLSKSDRPAGRSGPIR